MPRRVLVVEEDATLRGALACALEALGWQPHAARTEEEGHTVLADRPPRAVLLYSFRDPFRACAAAAVARAAAAAAVPVVLCSAAGDRHPADPEARLAASAVLTAPFDLGALGGLLASLLDSPA
jgi:DNA-binding NtrC family response regulator